MLADMGFLSVLANKLTAYYSDSRDFFGHGYLP